jgi:hypothetical protein
MVPPPSAWANFDTLAASLVHVASSVVATVHVLSKRKRFQKTELHASTETQKEWRRNMNHAFCFVGWALQLRWLIYLPYLS